MKRIVILTYGNFPNGEAASVRIYALARILLDMKYEVRIISMSREEPMVWREYNEIKYISIRSKGTDYISRAMNILLYVARIRKVLNGISDITVLMPLSLPIAGLLYCERYAKARGITLLTDRTEWYSPSEFLFGRFSPQYIQNSVTNRYIIDEYWKVISISRYLESYYRKKGIQTVRIPAIMDVYSITMNRMNSNTVRKVIYAGSPAKKDSLHLIVEAFSNCKTESITLHIYGVSEEQFDAKYPEFKVNKKRNVEFHGRVSRDEVLEALQNADFTTVFRNPNERFAKAGFPSKVAESLSSGTPVITNLTSDLELYLDNSNAIIVPEYAVGSYERAIKELERISDSEINLMKASARKTAEQHFDYSAYYDELKMLLSDLEEER